MHKNFVWLCFLSLVTGAVGWFTIKTLYSVYLYMLLNAETNAHQINWAVEKLSEDQFTLKANYSFEVKDQTFLGETLFNNDVYLNPYAAEESLKVYSSKDWTVWFSRFYPQYSSLQKNFPLKECISAVILWLIWLYFLGLGYYVTKRKS